MCNGFRGSRGTYLGEKAGEGTSFAYVQAWPEPYIYTLYDRIFGDFPAKNTVYTLHI